MASKTVIIIGASQGHGRRARQQLPRKGLQRSRHVATGRGELILAIRRLAPFALLIGWLVLTRLLPPFTHLLDRAARL